MVQFTLPKNSKIGEGKTWPHPAKAKAERELRIYRWNPDDRANPRLDTNTGKVTIDYRPVHTYTLTNDVAYVEPKARVY